MEVREAKESMEAREAIESIETMESIEGKRVGQVAVHHNGQCQRQCQE
jgi:hypothetical protein